MAEYGTGRAGLNNSGLCIGFNQLFVLLYLVVWFSRVILVPFAASNDVSV